MSQWYGWGNGYSILWPGTLCGPAMSSVFVFAVWVRASECKVKKKNTAHMLVFVLGLIRGCTKTLFGFQFKNHLISPTSVSPDRVRRRLQRLRSRSQRPPGEASLVVLRQHGGEVRVSAAERVGCGVAPRTPENRGALRRPTEPETLKWCRCFVCSKDFEKT